MGGDVQVNPLPGPVKLTAAYGEVAGVTVPDGLGCSCCSTFCGPFGSCRVVLLPNGKVTKINCMNSKFNGGGNERS